MESTKIQYANNTFNAWIGCHKVSDGCKHCYAEESQPARELRSGKIAATGFRKLEVWGPPSTTERYRTSRHNWKQPILWNKSAQERVQKFGPSSRTIVFLNSLSDTFEEHESVQKWQPDLWHLVEQTPNLLWLMFTKRPENIEKMFPLHWIENPLDNVWIGTSAENQDMFDKRVPILSKIPAMRRFVSIEPMLGPITTTALYCPGCNARSCFYDHAPTDGCKSCLDRMAHNYMVGNIRRCKRDYGIDWLILGGESGADARPLNVEWVHDIVRVVGGSTTAVFVKQLGSNVIDIGGRVELSDRKGGDIDEWPFQGRRDYPSHEF